MLLFGVFVVFFCRSLMGVRKGEQVVRTGCHDWECLLTLARSNERSRGEGKKEDCKKKI